MVREMTSQDPLTRRALLRAMAVGSVAAFLAACGARSSSATPSGASTIHCGPADVPAIRLSPRALGLAEARGDADADARRLDRSGRPAGQDRPDVPGRVPGARDRAVPTRSRPALAGRVRRRHPVRPRPDDGRHPQHQVAEPTQGAHRVAPRGGIGTVVHRHRPGGWQGRSPGPDARVPGHPLRGGDRRDRGSEPGARRRALHGRDHGGCRHRLRPRTGRGHQREPEESGDRRVGSQLLGRPRGRGRHGRGGDQGPARERHPLGDQAFPGHRAVPRPTPTSHRSMSPGPGPGPISSRSRGSSRPACRTW